MSDGDASLEFTPARYAKNYESWHDNLRDWCISRQLWWGHRIPVWHKVVTSTPEAPGVAGEAGFPGLDHIIAGENPDAYLRVFSEDGVELDPEAVLEIHHDAEKDDQRYNVFVCYRAPSPSSQASLESHGFQQDPDVLDTWFSSALWPMSTMGWPASDLPLVHERQIDQGDTSDVRSVWVKRVGSWKDFIGVDGELSGELIDRLLFLRDRHKNAGGPPALTYQLFSETDLGREGDQAIPLLKPDEIQEADDLVCAVAIKTGEVIQTEKFGAVDIPALLLRHGFQSTPGLLDAFNPTSVLCTAREIITLWVSRMVMFNRYFLNDGQSAMGNGSKRRAGPTPFHDVFIHAMIQDGDGRKMSKSLGNGVDPLDIIHSHGADAMRFTLVEMTTQTQDVRMPVEHDEATGRNTSPKFDLGRNFCNKLWNAARFAMGILGDGSNLPAKIDPADLTLADRWMLTRLREGIAEVDAALGSYQFSAYAKALYDVVRRDFCDWYLEAIKPTARDTPAQQAVLRLALDALLRILHPVIPFITESIHEHLSMIPAPSIEGFTLGAPRRGETLCTAAWPSVAESLADDEAVARFERVRTLVDIIRQTRSEHQVNPKRRITLHVSASLYDEIAVSAGLVETLGGVETVTTDPPNGNSVSLTFDGIEHRASNLADALDAAAESERLTKQLADLQKKLKTLDGRLSNPGYTDKAPAHLVQQTRDERDGVARDIEATEAAIGRLA